MKSFVATTQGTHPQKAFDSTSIALMLTLTAWLLLHGLGLNDYTVFGKITADLSQVAVEPQMQFLYSSPFMFALGKLLRPLGQGASFAVAYGCGLVLMCYTFWRWLEVTLPGRSSSALLFLLWSPLLIVTMHWMGKGDPWLLGFYMLHRSSKHRNTHVLWCLLMVLCHREMGTLLVLLECICQRQIRWASVPGLVLGHALIWLYHHKILDHVPIGRIGFLGDNWLNIPYDNLTNFFGFLALSLGSYWIYLFAFAPPKRQEVIALLICFGAALMTLDYTRVFTILALPIILVTLPRGLPAAHQWIQRKQALMVACALCLVSTQMVNGQLAFSKAPENLGQIQKILQPHVIP
jgi:hypothetical protein